MKVLMKVHAFSPNKKLMNFIQSEISKSHSDFRRAKSHYNTFLYFYPMSSGWLEGLPDTDRKYSPTGPKFEYKRQV